MSVPLARRQLLFRKGRTFAGLAGIATALLLVLALQAIFAGMQGRLTAYIDGSGADVIVAQQGVQTMHMTESALPERTAGLIAALPGVRNVQPIVYVPTTVERGEQRGLVYLIGDDAGGAPIPLARGRWPRSGEIVLDRVLADRLGVSEGSSVRILGRTFRVSGAVGGLTLITNSFAFVRRADLARTLRSGGVVSYVLVRAAPRTSPATLAHRIDASVPGVTASTRQTFARSERRRRAERSGSTAPISPRWASASCLPSAPARSVSSSRTSTSSPPSRPARTSRSRSTSPAAAAARRASRRPRCSVRWVSPPGATFRWTISAHGAAGGSTRLARHTPMGYNPQLVRERIR